VYKLFSNDKLCQFHQVLFLQQVHLATGSRLGRCGVEWTRRRHRGVSVGCESRIGPESPGEPRSATGSLKRSEYTANTHGRRGAAVDCGTSRATNRMGYTC
jgi:hypothetical protein